MEIFKAYLLSRGNSLHTVKAYLSDIRLYLLFCSHLKKGFFDKESLYTYFSYLSGKKKLSAPSLERKKAALKTYFLFLKKEGKEKEISQNYFKTPRKEKKIPNHFTEIEIQKILSTLQEKKTDLNYRNYFLVYLFYAGGFRLSELSSLKPSDIQLKEGWVRVIGKGNKERTIFLSENVVNEYRKYYALFQKTIEKNQSLFFNFRGEKLSPRGIEYILNSIGKKMNLNKNIHPHAFRHTYATHLLQNGADIRKVGEILGHSSLSTTQKYTHLNRKKLQEAYLEAHPHR